MSRVEDATVRAAIRRWWYADTIEGFARSSDEHVVGSLSLASGFAVTEEQVLAWMIQIAILRRALAGQFGRIYFEFVVPRLGKRVDVVLLIGGVVFVIEFKVGDTTFTGAALEQVWDYALDLRNFHESSHNTFIAPILVATQAHSRVLSLTFDANDPKLPHPMGIGATQLAEAISHVLEALPGATINPNEWEQGRYRPTPTIVEAARALYANHSVGEIARSGAQNLERTATTLERIIRGAQEHGRKSICFVTGVPGSGKTLVGLDIATRHYEKDDLVRSVFLSGNGPLVNVLREALARDCVERAKARQEKVTKSEARRRSIGTRQPIESFIQLVHHFRDECLKDPDPPDEHVALFDEAQRAWNLAQTSKFMQQKKGIPNFGRSEPEFLIECLNRHKDWAVMVCLVGSGQEINTGEAGLSEWIAALIRSFPDWRAHMSPVLHGAEYRSAPQIDQLAAAGKVEWLPDLHLSTSMRSFRAENLSEFVRLVLDGEPEAARSLLDSFRDRYPIFLSRDLAAAKDWVRERARGSERYGLLASSQAQRLKPHAIDVKSPINPVNWFLNGKSDVRSSYYLEDAATEFQVQGLEVDWSCVVWDGDLRAAAQGWSHNSFRGSKWNRIQQADRQRYLQNAYRVLLTRARQGMVVVVPQGSDADPTRRREYYDSTYDYLLSTGLPLLPATYAL